MYIVDVFGLIVVEFVDNYDYGDEEDKGKCF